MTPPIRLSIVGVKWPPETFIQRKILGLANVDFKVTVFSPDGFRVRAATKVAGIRVVPTPSLRKTSLRAWFRFARTLFVQLLFSPSRTLRCWAAARKSSRSLQGALQRFASVLPVLATPADIVHFEWNSAAIAFLPFWDLLEAKTVVSCRGSQVQISPLNPKRPQLGRELSATFERATSVHCVSEAIFREAMRYGLNPDKATIIRPAVDSELFLPNGQRAQRDTCHIISVGSLIWHKGYEYALMAVHHLKEEGFDVAWEIVGDGPERQRVLYTVLDLDLEDAVTLAGQLTPEQILARLQNADIFLLSSLSEGISNAVLEAMACGLPIVTTDCGGMREAVTDGIEGFVVPARDPRAMADALARLIHDVELRRRMGSAGRERVVEEFGLRLQLERFLALYHALTGARANSEG